MDNGEAEKNRARLRLEKLAGPRSDVARQPENPFLIETQEPYVAVRGKRNGYIMLAPSQETRQYSQLSPGILAAAHGWAIALEHLGASRVYWITLSDVNPHLHIHLFPRWPQDSLQGTALFDTRDNAAQPPWQDPVSQALLTWSQTFHAELV